MGSNFVKVEQKNISKQRQQQKNDANLAQYEAKYNQDAENRSALEQQRNDRFDGQKEAQAYAQQQKEENRARLDAENRRKEAERAQKQTSKTFIQRINGLLDEKSCGVDFDNFANEFYFKWNVNWDPQSAMGLTDLEDIFGRLSSTVQVVRGGMTKRAIAKKHYAKIKIISTNTNDILTVLAISENIDGAIRQLRQMINQRENAKKQQQQQERDRARRDREKAQMQTATLTFGGSNSNTLKFGGSNSNNFGL